MSYCVAVNSSSLAISNIDADCCFVYSFDSGTITELVELFGEIYYNFKTTPRILQKACAAFSSDGNLFAFNTNKGKLLSIWNANNWTMVDNKLLPKDATNIVFTPKTNVAIAGDKKGDVYSFENDPVRILGHSSMILGICFSRDEKYIVTSDSDEKIRVSHYPNGKIILHYMMGHEAYVSNICLLNNFLVSGSGDCTLRLWDLDSGDLVDKLILDRPIRNVVEVSVQHCTAAVQFHDSNELYFVKLEKNNDNYNFVKTQQEIFQSKVINIGACDKKLWIFTKNTIHNYTVAKDNNIFKEENNLVQETLKEYTESYTALETTDLMVHLYQKMIDRKKRIKEHNT
ncbi:tRNA (guanine-N(7)-)-methyltransferase non-catalytic subunit, Trm82,WD40-repeat-containing [Cinara cedri]|uniref:tRNA (Guanine-N(7)-)-methyltransferase non-catalytic subunit, Trm82,WD40-repeat-containing n=1 Tax=Cinara cedri TaxID=506608 RepID=A0A5E4NAM3_9HEMI|nr:tRNA (guanine-N(7)-)-methyltransferase non-catalytic subunit, Trm82,WD40-repeat-containing [Cinara cedri]